MKIYTIHKPWEPPYLPITTEYPDDKNLSHHFISCADFVFHFQKGRTIYSKNRYDFPGYQYSEEDIIMAKLGQLPDPNLPYLTHHTNTNIITTSPEDRLQANLTN